ncbi:MAG TPA: serine/threonine-protein kinase [Planctomycetota bacterium]|nr:serine/threonine-protein kinase [Planctomycetota bacterium]
MKCPVCDAEDLAPLEGSDTSVACGKCRSTLSRCIYCGQTTFRLLGDVCTCVNPRCVAREVPWRRCPDCDRFGIPLLGQGSEPSCIDNSHTLAATVRCFSCEHEYPSGLGACIHRGCKAALQLVSLCPDCGKRSLSVRSKACLDPSCPSARVTAATVMEPPPRAPADAFVDHLFQPTEERYELERLVFSGGMGEIYRAKDRLLGRSVAYKVARKDVAENQGARSQFLKEARIGARLLHPNVLPIFDAGVDRDRRVYFTMRFVEGASLGNTIDAIATGCATNFVEFPLRKFVGSFLKACQGVDFAHSHGVLHLDLKPQNVLVSGFNEVFVIDWGIARIDGEDDTNRIIQAYGKHSPDPAKSATSTLVGHADAGKSRPIVGTPGYMAPEQFEGATERFGPHTDVFGLGGILYYMLYGDPPCRPGEGGTIMDALKATLEPQKAGKLRPGIVPRGERVKKELTEALALLEAIALKCLERDPKKRYPTVEDIIIDVNEWLAGSKVLDHDSRAAVG